MQIITGRHHYPYHHHHHHHHHHLHHHYYRRPPRRCLPLPPPPPQAGMGTGRGSRSGPSSSSSSGSGSGSGSDCGSPPRLGKTDPGGDMDEEEPADKDWSRHPSNRGTTTTTTATTTTTTATSAVATITTENSSQSSSSALSQSGVVELVQPPPPLPPRLGSPGTNFSARPGSSPTVQTLSSPGLLSGSGDVIRSSEIGTRRAGSPGSGRSEGGVPDVESGNHRTHHHHQQQQQHQHHHHHQGRRADRSEEPSLPAHQSAHEEEAGGIGSSFLAGSAQHGDLVIDLDEQAAAGGDHHHHHHHPPQEPGRSPGGAPDPGRGGDPASPQSRSPSQRLLDHRSLVQEEKLVAATLASLDQSGTASNIIKQDLRLIIQSRRKAEGKEELSVDFRAPAKEELSEEEWQRAVRRRDQNRRAAQRFRHKQRQLSSSLSDRVKQLEAVHRQLLSERRSLEEEKAALLKMVHSHSRVCKDFDFKLKLQQALGYRSIITTDPRKWAP